MTSLQHYQNKRQLYSLDKRVIILTMLMAMLLQTMLLLSELIRFCVVDSQSIPKNSQSIN